MQFCVIPGHADIESDFAQGMAGIVLHAQDILILLEAVAVVDEDRDDADPQGNRQQQSDHQFDKREAVLLFW